MSNQLYNQNSRRKIYIVRHIITVRFPFTYSLIPPDDFCRPTKLFAFFCWCSALCYLTNCVTALPAFSPFRRHQIYVRILYGII